MSTVSVVDQIVGMLLTAVPGLVGAFVVLLVYHGWRLYRFNPVEDVPWESVVSIPRDRDRETRKGPLSKMAGRLVPSFRAALPRGLLTRIQRQIDLAGRPPGMDVDAVLTQVLVWMLMVTPLAAYMVPQGQGLLVLLLAVAALLIPIGRLAGLARKRREAIDRDLPDFMDVVAVTVSAGIGFRQSLGTVAARFGGPLAEEIQTTLYQIDNGASVRSAFSSFRQRTASEPVEEFVSAYLQAEELGAPLVQTLNQIAGDMRRATAQRLRQRANKVAPRVTLVTTLMMVPGAMILLLAGLAVGSGLDFGGLLGNGG